MSAEWHETSPVKSHLYGITYMMLASFFFASVEITSRYIEGNDNPFQTVWVRYATHLGFMLLVFAPRVGFGLLRTKNLKLQLARPLTMIGMPLFFIGGLMVLPAHEVWALFWVSPVMVLALAALLLKEPIGWLRWLGTILCLLAVWIVMRPDLKSVNWTFVLPFGMAFCYSLYRVLTRMLRNENSLTSLFYSAIVVFIPFSLFLPLFWQPMTLGGIIPRVFIGLLGYATLYCLDKAYEIAPAAVMAPFSFSQVPFLLLLGYVFLHEVPDRLSLLGCAILIIIGGALFVYELHSARQAERTSVLQTASATSQSN
jgi:drug/metabolite transporter (DMT)-like permease